MEVTLFSGPTGFKSSQKSVGRIIPGHPRFLGTARFPWALSMGEASFVARFHGESDEASIWEPQLNRFLLPMLGPYSDRQVFSTKMITKCGFNMTISVNHVMGYPVYRQSHLKKQTWDLRKHKILGSKFQSHKN